MDNLTFYEKKAIYMIEGEYIEEPKTLRKDSTCIVRVEEYFKFDDPKNEHRAFRNMDIYGDYEMKNLDYNIKHNDKVKIKFVSVSHFAEYFKIKRIWKGTIGILTNLNYYDFLNHYCNILYFTPFSSFCETDKELIAEKNYEAGETVINIMYNLEKL